MKVTLRLYRQHDLDLIALFKNESFSLPKAIKKALVAYIRKEPLSIEPPAADTLSGHNYRQCQMRIYLNDDSDKDIIDWLENISKGYRNSLIKNITRVYFTTPCIYPYYHAGCEEKTMVSNKVLKAETPMQFSQTPETPEKKKKEKEHLTGEQIADRILKTPLKEITKDTISKETVQTPNLPEQISIPKPQAPEDADRSAQKELSEQMLNTEQPEPTKDGTSYLTPELPKDDYPAAEKPSDKVTDEAAVTDELQDGTDFDPMEAFEKMMEGLS